MADAFDGLAGVAVRIGDRPRAATLIVASDHLRSVYDRQRPLVLERRTDELRAGVARLVSDAEREDAGRFGAVMATDEAMAYALGEWGAVEQPGA